jgi:hypothetical protein
MMLDICALTADEDTPYVTGKKRAAPIVCLNSKCPLPVELCWKNKNISKLGIDCYNQSW